MNQQPTNKGSPAFQEATRRCAEQVGRECRVIAILFVLCAIFSTWLPVWMQKDYADAAKVTTVMLLLAIVLVLKEMVLVYRLKNGLYGTDPNEVREIIKHLQEE